MPIEWKNFKDNFKTDLKDSAKETNDKLASGISSLTKMTDDEIKQLFPTSADVKKLAELMKIVKSAEDRNNKINQIVKNAEKFGGIVLTLLNKFV